MNNRRGYVGEVGYNCEGIERRGIIGRQMYKCMCSGFGLRDRDKSK